jgi:hypothetical protein
MRGNFQRDKHGNRWARGAWQVRDLAEVPPQPTGFEILVSSPKLRTIPQEYWPQIPAIRLYVKK